MRHFYETKSASFCAVSHTRLGLISDGAKEGMADRELFFFSGGGNPGFAGDELFDGVAFFVAVVFAIAEGVILGRDAVVEFEAADGMLGRVDGALEFAEE